MLLNEIINEVGMTKRAIKYYALYMADPIHPTKAGYLKWWTPKIEEGLYAQFE